MAALRRLPAGAQPAAVVLAVVAVTGALRAVGGTGSLGYDAAYALAWAHELGDGVTPSFDATRAPTPHPLLNGAAVLASLFGSQSGDVLLLLTQLGFGTLVVAASLLGWRLAGAVAGALTGVAVFTRAPLIDNALDGGVDVGFVALVIAALAADAREHRRPVTVLGLLACAGLLRPEAWLLSCAYVIVHRRDLAGRSRPMVLGLLAAGPLAWCCMDLLVTGSPVWSLTGTRELAADLERPRGVLTSLELFPRFVVWTIGAPIALSGALGCIAAVWLQAGRFRPALGVLLLTALAFVALGAAGLPLITRYVALPAVLLAVFCGVLAAVPALLGRWEAWGVGCVLLATIAVVLPLPGEMRNVSSFRADAAARKSVQRDLELLAKDPVVRSALLACPTIWSPTHRPVPFVSRVLNTPARDVQQGYPETDAAGVFFGITSSRAAAAFHLQGADREPSVTPIPAGFLPLARRGPWVAAARCERTAGSAP